MPCGQAKVQEQLVDDVERESSVASIKIRPPVEIAGRPKLVSLISSFQQIAAAKTSLTECIPANQNRTDTYSVSYVNGLEEQVAGLLGRVSQHSSDSTIPGHPISDGNLAHNTQPNEYTESQSFINSLEGLHTPAVSALGNTGFDFLSYQDENLFSITQQPSSHIDNPADLVSYSGDPMNPSAGATAADIVVCEGASFFQTYFEVIHPRYPFLDIEECSAAYLKWKMGEMADGDDKAWPTRLLKLIFANGAILQHVGFHHKVHRQYQELALQQQNITMYSSLGPLARLQAMLLHAFYALHGENTEQVVHDVGIAMRFAILHGFHRLTSDGTHETDNKIKTWWSIYW
ncbi:Ff.00g099850.m01.CDS01 [Fusarium sp. VM40]|nr:Ff.00g099850.m01.CDS01 [Fusarium sp. VM40]